jgi:hypothetical protein
MHKPSLNWEARQNPDFVVGDAAEMVQLARG